MRPLSYVYCKLFLLGKFNLYKLICINAESRETIFRKQYRIFFSQSLSGVRKNCQLRIKSMNILLVCLLACLQ